MRRYLAGAVLAGAMLLMPLGHSQLQAQYYPNPRCFITRGTIWYVFQEPEHRPVAGPFVDPDQNSCTPQQPQWGLTFCNLKAEQYRKQDPDHNYLCYPMQ